MCRESGHGIPHMDASAAHPDAHRGCCVYHERAESLLPEAYFATLTRPLTEKLEKLVDAEALCRMIPSAHLVNMAP
jgi:lactate dehydrogenase-like 2-hydroxyacid dehydrogenase